MTNKQKNNYIIVEYSLRLFLVLCFLVIVAGYLFYSLSGYWFVLWAVLSLVIDGGMEDDGWFIK